jgi:hypothetical protein
MQTLASLRDTAHGSWLIECLCEAFMRHACDLDLRELLDLTKLYLREKETETVIF